MSKIDDGVFVLPDGSAFYTGSLPLPEDHWIYSKDSDGFTGPPPMTLLTGTKSPERKVLESKIAEAARYAVRASTMCGKDMDFDPDALVQNMIIGMLGYYTEDGRGSESWMNPDFCSDLTDRLAQKND
jgi:hypothetical protein